jgi:hypothetical protein
MHTPEDGVVELEYQKIIVEEDFPNQLSTAEMFQAVEFMTKVFKTR